MATGLSELNRELNLIPRRAEQHRAGMLRDTFVDSGVSAILAAVDHQLMYGRRGTGKTHALRYLEAEAGLRGDVGVYVDLRTIGSPDGLFLGDTIPATERAARLLVDLLGELHEQLRRAILEDPGLTEGAGGSDLFQRLDRLVDAITTVRIVGDVELSQEGEHGTTERHGVHGSARVGPTPSVGFGVEAADERTARRLRRETRTGTERLGLNFGDVARSLREIVRALQGRRLWLLLDEWSSVPLDVQPLLGEFLVRCVLPISDVTVKIASLEQHTNFREDFHGTLVGLEVGADITANVDLDEFMVFDQSEERARSFLRSLLFRHLRSAGRVELTGEADLAGRAFEDPTAFDELVRASEGVPRDAINIVAKAATQAGERPISTAQVRAAARSWYQSDKEAALRNRDDVRELLTWIVDQVVRERRCRGFLVSQRSGNAPLLRILFDARVLHMIRRGYFAPEARGERYDLWVVDYGAYVDLVGTDAEPESLLPREMANDPADPNELRRAVLDLEEYTRLPPLLDASPTLDQLLPALHETEEFGLQAVWEGRGSLQTVVAIVDQPAYQRRDPLWLDLSGAAGNVAVCGGPQSGKSALLRTLITSLALTHSPAEAGFYCFDFGGGALVRMRDLPHVGGVATRRDGDAVRRTIYELTQLLEHREQRFSEQEIDGIGAYRRLRRQDRTAPDRCPTDVFLVVDGWAHLAEEYDEHLAAVLNLAARGLGFGIHVLVTMSTWSGEWAPMRGSVATRLELRLGDPDESIIDRTMARYVPAQPGRGLSPDGLHMVVAEPRLDGDHRESRIRSAWKGGSVPAVRLLPDLLERPALERAVPADIRDLPIGLDEERFEPVMFDPDLDSHLLVAGQQECGKSNLLGLILTGILERFTPKEAKVVVVDYRRSLLDLDLGTHALGYAASHDAADELLRNLTDALRRRMPGPDVTPEQLKSRTWWTGPDVYVVVDDYELVATTTSNPLARLAEFVPTARDVGLHVVLARGFGGIARAMTGDPVLSRLNAMGAPAFIMSGTRDEGADWWAGYRPRPLPPGRGALITRRHMPRLVQTAYLGLS